MEPRFEILTEKKLVGLRRLTNFAENTAPELWRRFMPRRKEILHVAGPELYSVELYPPDFFKRADHLAQFEQWAAVAVQGEQALPPDMAELTVPAGLYAVFIHRGPASEAAKTYHYIFRTWLPRSGYAVDPRPHFAVMGANYRPDDPQAEEDVWIPVAANT